MKGAEFNGGRQGVYSSYRLIDRASRFRSLGDGQVDFAGISQAVAIWLRLGGARMGMLPGHPRDGR